MKKEENNRINGIKKTVLAAGGLYFINEYIDSEYRRSSTLSYGNGRTFQWNKRNIYYRVKGEGIKPLLFIHDCSPDSSGEEWRDLENELRKEYKIYTVDLPGCGRSDKKEGTYTNYYYMTFLTNFINQVIQKKAIIITSGLSGSFAVMAAYAHPDLIEKIYMINPTDLKMLKKIPDKKSRRLKILLHSPIIGKTIYYIVMNERNIERKIRRNMVYDSSSVKKRTIKRSYDAAHAGKGEGKNLLLSREGGYLNWNIEKALHSVKVPVTIIEGAKTRGNKIIIKRYKKVNNAIQVVYIANAALLPQIEKPKETAAVLL